MLELGRYKLQESIDSTTEEDDKEEFVIDEILTKNGFIEITGQPKGGKSFFSMNLAISLALGEDFIRFKIPKKMKVVYVNTEMTGKTARKRFRKILKQKNKNCNMYEVFVESLKGRKERDFDKFVEYMDSTYSNEGIDVVVIDPIYKLLDDENDNSLLKKFLDALDDLRNKNDWSFILVHHKGKSASNIQDVAFRGCGGTIIGRDADTIIDLTIDKDKANAMKTIKVELSGRFDYSNMEKFTTVLNDGVIEEQYK